MRKMKCQGVRREIEETNTLASLSSAATEHLQSCVACEAFGAQQTKLREMMSSLGTVEAPDDFDFRLRARLAGERRGVTRPFALGNFSFGFRGAAFASLLLLFASALLFVSIRSPRDTSLTASDATPAATGVDTKGLYQPVADQQSDQPTVALSPNTLNTQATPVQKSRGEKRPAVIASAGNASRLKTRDMASVPARVLRPSDLTARASDFPIETRSQALKVSLDDGNGSSRTISLPAVSFGSQRAVSQSTSPLMASARGSW